jgi:hypothetical protein
MPKKDCNCKTCKQTEECKAFKCPECGLSGDNIEREIIQMVIYSKCRGCNYEWIEE